MSKSKLIAVFATGAVLASQIGVATPAYAATSYYGTHIYTSGSLVSSPSHIDAMDSGNLTAFLPLFYVNQALAKFDITGTWDGNNWNLTLPQGMNADMSNPQTGQQTNSSTLSMSINGQVVQYAPRQVAGDPANSGQATTYLPIWYIDQVIGRLAINATWDGTNWAITRTTPATKLQTVKDFMSVLGIPGDSSGTNPYDDVSASDWPVIHKAIENGYFSPDSTTHFGSDDSISVNDVDHAYQLSLGIPDSHMSWNAGGNLAAWSQIVGLNNGVSDSSVLSTSDEGQIMANISHLQQGYYRDSSGVYHVMFKPYDSWLYSSSKYSSRGYTQSEVVTDMANGFKVTDAVTFTVNGSTVTYKLPGLSDQDPQEISIGAAGTSYYSVDGGKTWHQPPNPLIAPYTYDSRDWTDGGQVSAPSYILARGSLGLTLYSYSVIENNNDNVYNYIKLTYSSNGQPSIQCLNGFGE